MDHQIFQLDQVASVSPGYPHRRWDGDQHPTHRLLPIKALDDARLGVQPELSVPFAPQFDVGRARLRPGDVVLATRGDRRKAGVVEDVLGDDAAGPLTASEQLTVIRPEPLVNPRYLALILNGPVVQRQIADISRGSHIAYVSLRDLVKITIPVPPLDEQRKLVGLHDLVVRERDLMARLARRRQDLLDALVSQTTTQQKTK